MSPPYWLGLVLLTALPAVGGLLLNRRLDPRLDDETLPARGLRLRIWRLVFLWLAVVWITLEARERPLLFLLLMPAVAGSLFAGWDARRRLLDEDWSFPAYTRFTLGYLTSQLAPLLLLTVAPWIVVATPEPWMAGIVTAVVLWLLFYFRPRLLPWLVGARPWRVDPTLGTRFDDIDAEAGFVPSPRRLLLPVGSGKVYNAMAVLDPARPTVLFTSALAERFDVERLTAIYAHEVSHLEQVRRSSAYRGMTWGMNALIPIGTLLIPWLRQEKLPTVLADWLWILLVAGLLMAWGRWLKGLELGADARAVDLLGGNGAALATGLEDLYRLQRMPRRMSPEMEGRLTHPSLARRLQAIRRLSGHESARPVEDGVFLSPDGTSALVFTRDRLHRLDDLSGEAPTTRDPEELTRRAGSARSDAYAVFHDLRLDRDSKRRPRVIGEGVGGPRWTRPVREEDVPRLTAWLDAVDGELGEAPRLSPLGPMARRYLSLLGILLTFSALPALPAVLLTGLAVLVTGRRVPTVAAAASLLGAAFVLGTRVGIGSNGPDWASAALPLGIALILGWSAWRAPVEDRIAPWALTFGTLGALGLAAVWLATGVTLGARPADVWFALSNSLAAWAWCWIFWLATAAVLALRPRFASRVGAAVLALAALGLAILSTVPTRRALAPDPLDGVNRAEVALLELRETDRRPVGGGDAIELRVAPGGRRAALLDWMEEDANRWRVVSRNVSGEPITETLVGGSFEFLGPDTGVHHDTVGASRLIHLDFASGERRELAVDDDLFDLAGGPGENWILAGDVSALFGDRSTFDGEAPMFQEYIVGGGFSNEAGGARSRVWMPDRAVSLITTWRFEPVGWWPPGRGLPSTAKTVLEEMRWTEDGVGEPVLSTRLGIECPPLQTGSDLFCLVTDRDAAWIARVPLDGVSEPRVLVDVENWVWRLDVRAAGDWVLLTAQFEGSKSWLWRRSSETLYRLPQGAGTQELVLWDLTLAAEGTPLVARLEGDDLVLYEPHEPTPSGRR